MKQSRRELAKQLLTYHMEARQDEWCADGLVVCKILLDCLDQKHVQVQVTSSDYAVYDGTDSGSHDRIGEVFTLDLDGFADDFISNPDMILDDRWSIQTLESPYLDFYLLLNVEEMNSYE